MDTTDSNVVPLGRHPTSDELITRARALVSVLQERAQRCEDQRRVPEETIQDFKRAGLLRMCQPARYGGYELGWDVLCDVGEVLAAACGSQAWLQHIFADHTVLVRVDGAVPYGRAVEAMDVSKAAGAERIGLVAR